MLNRVILVIGLGCLSLVHLIALDGFSELMVVLLLVG